MVEERAEPEGKVFDLSVDLAWERLGISLGGAGKCCWEEGRLELLA